MRQVRGAWCVVLGVSLLVGCARIKQWVGMKETRPARPARARRAPAAKPTQTAPTKTAPAEPAPAKPESAKTTPPKRTKPIVNLPLFGKREGPAPKRAEPARTKAKPAPAPKRPAPRKPAPARPQPPSAAPTDVTRTVKEYNSDKITIHPGAKVGDFARWQTGGATLTWAVLDKKNSDLLVEMRTDVKTPQFRSSTVYLYVCDPTGKLKKVFVGAPGKKAREIPIRPIAVQAEKPTLQTKTISQTPEKATVRAGTFDTTKKVTEVTVQGRAVRSIMWTSPKTFFTGVVKTASADGTVTQELIEHGSKPALKPSLVP